MLRVHLNKGFSAGATPAHTNKNVPGSRNTSDTTIPSHASKLNAQRRASTVASKSNGFAPTITVSSGRAPCLAEQATRLATTVLKTHANLHPKSCIITESYYSARLEALNAHRDTMLSVVATLGWPLTISSQRLTRRGLELVSKYMLVEALVMLGTGVVNATPADGMRCAPLDHAVCDRSHWSQ